MTAVFRLRLGKRARLSLPLAEVLAQRRSEPFVPVLVLVSHANDMRLAPSGRKRVDSPRAAPS